MWGGELVTPIHLMFFWVLDHLCLSPSELWG